MNEEKDQKPEGREQDFAEFAKDRKPRSGDVERGGSGGSFMRGCAIAAGVVALVFFFIVGTCFLG